MFRLVTFGRLRLVDREEQQVPFPEKGLLILAQARVDGWQQKSRAEIARLFWGEVDQTQAYANLRKTISRIVARQEELNVSFFEFSADSVSVSPDTLACDLDDLTPCKGMGPLDFFLELSAQLQADFLFDIRLQGRTLNNWVESQRKEYMLLLRQALLDAIEFVTPANRVKFKLAALKILEQYPGDEAIRSTLARIYGGVDHRQKMPGDGGRSKIPAVARSEGPISLQIEKPGEQPIAIRPPRMVLLPPGPSKSPVGAFASALIEDVTIGLCSFRSVSIIAPHSAAQISQNGDKSANYERHSISYVLDTRITDEGDGYTLFAQLIFFGSDEVIWANRFDIAGDRLMNSRRELAFKIASAISDKVDQNEVQRLFFERNGAAYKDFLLGQQILNRLDLSLVRRARKHFKGALRQDANFAPALSGLARSFFFEWLLTARGDKELLSLAEQHATHAITANTSLAAGYRELGVVKLYQRQYDESVDFLRRAEALSPNYANVLASFADTLVQASKPDEGLEKIKLALDLNPLAPDEYFWTAAGASYSLGEYEQALKFIDRMKDQLPADRLAAACWGMLGNAKKAKQLVARTFEVHPEFDLDRWMAIVPFKEEWQKKHYFEGLKSAGFQ